MTQIELPDIPDLCSRLVNQLDDSTRGDLRLVLFTVAINAKGTAAESWLAEMFDHLEPQSAPDDE